MAKRAIYILVISAIIFGGCKTPQSFEYREVKDIKLVHLGLNKTIISMNLVYYNPNDFGVTLKKIDCDVSLNHNFLGKYLLDTTLYINKKSVFVVPASVKFDWLDFLKKSASIILNKEALVGVKGTTRISKWGIGKNVPIQYESNYKIPF